MVKRLILLVIETGTVTGQELFTCEPKASCSLILIYSAVFAILTLILTVLPGHPSYYQVPSAILAKVYSNSMMVVLNSRMDIGINGDKLRDAHSTFHFPDALAQGGTRTTEMYELSGEHGANVSTDEVLFAKMDNAKVSSLLIHTHDNKVGANDFPLCFSLFGL
jgi:hypothetical protein